MLAATPVPGLVRLPVGELGRRPRTLVGGATPHCARVRLRCPGGIWTGTGIIPSTTVSTPTATWHAFVQLWNHDDLFGYIGVSARRAAFGLALGAGIGLLLGIVVGLTRLGEGALRRFHADAPHGSLPRRDLPLHHLVRYRGDGQGAPDRPGHALFPMYLNTSNGVRNVDKRVLVEAARSFGVQGWVLVRRVVVPLALPSIMTGLRYSAGISVIALVFTESIGANQGIGYLVSQADSLQQIPVLVVCVVIYALLGIGADLLVRLLERVQHAVETAPGGPMNPARSRPTWLPSSTR